MVENWEEPQDRWQVHRFMGPRTQHRLSCLTSPGGAGRGGARWWKRYRDGAMGLGEAGWGEGHTISLAHGGINQYLQLFSTILLPSTGSIYLWQIGYCFLSFLLYF